MDTKQYAEPDYITAQLVKESKTQRAIILGDATIKDIEYAGKHYERLQVMVELDGRKKSYSPNKDTLKNIHSVLGTESRNWIGRTLRLRVLSINGKDSIIGDVLTTPTEAVE